MKKYIYSFITLLTAVFALSSCEDVPAPYSWPEAGGSSTISATGSGTADDPFNVAAAIEKCKETGTTLTDEVYYIKGVVKTVDTSGAASYGNISIDMIDEGGSDVFKAFQILGIGGAKFTEETANAIKEGDVVVVKGKVYNYSGNTPETESKGAAQLVSVNGEGGGQEVPGVDPAGAGTEADPFNVAAAIKKCQETGETATTDQYYVKGTVKSVNTSGAATYGNINIDMTDPNGSEVFTAFQVMSIGGEKFTESTAAGIKAGDVVVVKGNLVNYKGNTPETTGKGAGQVVSVNGKTTIEGGSDNPGGGDSGSTAAGVTQEGTIVTLGNADATAGTETISCDLNTYGWENAAEPTEVTLSDGTKISFAKGEGSTTPKFYTATKGVRMYAKNTLTINGAKKIAKVVIECDSYNGTDYVGNPTMTVSFSGNNCVMNNEHTSASGGVQCRAKVITITYAK